MKKRERELAKPGAIVGAIAVDPTLAKAIDRYTEESIKDISRTKTQVLKAIKNYDIANMPCSTIGSKDIVAFLQSLTARPQTVGNYASHLAAIFAIARPMWDYRLDEQEMKDAIKVARRMGIVSRSIQRNRRPTLEELDQFSSISWIAARRSLKRCRCTRSLLSRSSPRAAKKRLLA